MITGIIFLLSADSYSQEAGPDGSFNYEVQIKLPPGTNSMEPKLALVYNSNSGNGIAGMGWSLSGLTAIARDSSFGIKYNAADRFVSSKGRLIEIGNDIYITNMRPIRGTLPAPRCREMILTTA